MGKAEEGLLEEYRKALEAPAMSAADLRREGPEPSPRTANRPSGSWLSMIVLERGQYRRPPTDVLVRGFEAAGYQVCRRPHAPRFGDVMKSLRGCPRKPHLVLTWDEHGELFRTQDWQAAVTALYAQGVTVAYLDYGYFNRNRNLLLDLYLPDGSRTIERDWATLSEDDPWPTAPPPLQAYRQAILDHHARALKEAPLVEEPYGVVWTQQTATLLRPGFLVARGESWIAGACEMLVRSGLKPVVKISPYGCPAVPAGVQTVGDRKKWNQHENARLAAFSRANVVICSSVTHELVLIGAPVTALGRSWFNGLGVFHEPLGWSEAPVKREQIDARARNRWAAWWISRQVPFEAVPARVKDVALLGRSIMSPPPARELPASARDHPLVVCYHTDEGFYARHVKRLTSSLERFGLEHRIYVQPNTGDWKRNTFTKPFVIRRAMCEYPHRRIIWLDADSEIQERPALLLAVDADFAAHWYRGWQLNSGTLMFAPTEAARHLVDLWIDRLRPELLGDQDALGEAFFLARRHGLRAVNLPLEYLAMDGHEQSAHPVVRHFQGSRVGRSIVGLGEDARVRLWRAMCDLCCAACAHRLVQARPDRAFCVKGGAVLYTICSRAAMIQERRRCLYNPKAWPT